MDIIKRFLKKNRNDIITKKSSILEEKFEDDESDIIDEEGLLIRPPILYIKPKMDDIKELAKIYFEIKKLI